jgi:MFS family permease
VLTTIRLVTTTPPEGSGAGLALAYLVVAVVLLIVFGPLAFLIGRDANRRGRNGWAWKLLFFWQPVIVGIAYLFARRRRIPGPPTPAGWYPDPGGRMRWWDGNTWTEHTAPQ